MTKRPSFCVAVTFTVAILVLLVQEAHLLSPLGRRYGRSLTKKFRIGKQRRAHFDEREKIPYIPDGNPHNIDWSLVSYIVVNRNCRRSVEIVYIEVPSAPRFCSTESEQTEKTAV